MILITNLRTLYLKFETILKRLNTSRTYNFYIIQKGKYYNNIVDKWKKSGPYTTLSYIYEIIIAQ